MINTIENILKEYNQDFKVLYSKTPDSLDKKLEELLILELASFEGNLTIDKILKDQYKLVRYLNRNEIFHIACFLQRQVITGSMVTLELNLISTIEYNL